MILVDALNRDSKKQKRLLAPAACGGLRPNRPHAESGR